MYGFTVSSVVPAPPDVVWDRVASFDGVNDELMPIVRMTAPRAMRRIDPAVVPLGRPWFRSWLLLFGVLPFDWDHLRILAIEPGRGFHEDSTMLSQRRWVHRRRLEPAGEGTRVTDDVEFEPRLPGVGPFLRPVFAAVFRHRHRRLGAFFAAGGARGRTDGRGRP
jgi:ligand-binding SRPBCC domain-containing protein